MMIGVVVVAMVMGVAQLLALSGRHRARAGLHGSLERKCARLADEFEATYVRTAAGCALRDAPNVLVPLPEYAPAQRLRTMATWNYPSWEGADARTQAPHDADEWRSEAARHSRLRAKYERAAWNPWVSVPPDPAEPK
jgi:hypothetical protein